MSTRPRPKTESLVVFGEAWADAFAPRLPLHSTEPAECDDTNAGSSGASSPRCSPPAKLTGAKRGADALSPAAPPNAPTPSTSRPAGRSGVRRSLKQRQSADVDDAASCSTATFSSTVTTPLTSPQCGQPSPFVCPSALSSPSKGSSSNAAMAPEVEVGSEMSSTGVSPMNSPERKIWMRPCNGCGFELHVRRVKCTECGTVQMSKRAYAAAKDEKIKEEERATDDMYKQAMAAEEAAEAASQLALICESPGGTSTHVRRAEAAPEESTPNAAAMAAPPAPPSPAHSTSSHASVVSQLARLTPAQLTKLRRMQKLRTLLTKLPPGVTLPRTLATADDAATDGAAAAEAPAPSSGGSSSTDAIAMLASVACM